MWVNAPNSTLCSETGDPCSSAGTYDADSSSTYAFVNDDFNISYVDGSGAAGNYVSDTVRLGDTDITDLQFGIGFTSSSAEGILGIGYKTNEVQVGRAGLKEYANLPAAMVEQKFIQSNAYSLWLNDLDSNTGSILFGGVDTDRYTGSLETLPVQTTYGYYAEFLITLTSISLGSQSLGADLDTAVLLDSGSSLTYLPDAITESIFTAVGASYSSSVGAAYVPCSLANNDTTVDFTFTSPTISVAMRELVLETSSTTGEPLTFSNGERACLFGIAPAGSSTSVLGDTFIRSAYIVYDLANNEISLAQTTFNATTSHVVEIGTGTAAVPDATLVANAATAAAQTGGASIDGTVTLVAGTATSTAGARRTAAAAPLGAMAAIGVGAMYAAL